MVMGRQQKCYAALLSLLYTKQMDYRKLEDITIATYDQNAMSWVSSHGKISDWGENVTQLTHYLPEGSLLEIGCGGAREAAQFVKLGYDYLGTDASAGMVRAAQADNPECSFQTINVYDLPNLGRTFDGFWACAVLLHVPKKRIDEALQAISAVLKPGAVGMISLKDGDKEDFEVRNKHGRHEERLFVYWRKDAFVRVLQRNGFSVLEHQYRAVSERTNWHIFYVKKKG